MVQIKLRYFAAVREAVGRGEERLQTEAADCAALRAELIARGGAWAEALARERAVRVAVNQVLQHDEHAALSDGDEVAFFRPSPEVEMPEASPASRFSVSVQSADFDVGAELAALRAGEPQVGAVCSFVGTVRDTNSGSAVASMELEHYPGMTEKSILQLIDAARSRFRLLGVRVIHRVGLLQPQDQIVLVAVTSSHRGDAFQACEYLMDYLKTRAPFWKKEATPTGAVWVDARVSDEEAAARWERSPDAGATRAAPAE